MSRSKFPAPVLMFLKPFCPICGAIFAGVAVSVAAKVAVFLDCGVVACGNRLLRVRMRDMGAGACARARVYMRVLSPSHRHISLLHKYMYLILLLFFVTWRHCGVVAV